ncbi:1,3-beta-glucanosyltransferase gel1 [Drechslerella dactyloides]|uniref:1,3-beta-glucanosyltransferase n=1 Tax=Drechslerella dactyloides TaxID=74499 RepID=A0AAD6IUH8_DREDA|nr:1,3-beta-glucanosyltransferase gel1 [Drechslerella dactyloides]
MRFSTLAGLASLAVYVSADLTPITIKGNAFYAGNDRFYVRGVDYQPGAASDPKDPLADPKICGRDIPALKDLGVNAIRVYIIDSAANHDECMKQLSDAGIYLILDVNTPRQSISRANPSGSYNEVYLQHVFGTMDVFSKYANTMAFFAGNEVVDKPDNTAAATYVKATVRDMKAYQKARKLRAIPVGYSAADVTSNRQLIAEYMNSGPDAERVDFHAYNDYSWCGTGSSFTFSGYDQKVKNYTDYGIPTFLSEFGCNKFLPRTFPEIEAIYSTQMTGVFSGGLVYEWTQEENKFGLVKVSQDLKSIELMDDYKNLKSQYQKTPNPNGDAGATLTPGKASKCPSKVPGIWDAECTLPDMPAKAKGYLDSGAGQVLGFSGPTNQWDTPGTPSSGSGTGTASSAAKTTSAKNSASGPLPAVNFAAIASIGSIVLAGIFGGAALL